MAPRRKRHAVNDRPVIAARRPRIAEIAARAGVSPATVDRVLNGRAGVRGDTIARVTAAMHTIGQDAGGAALGRFDIILAQDDSAVTVELADVLAGLIGQAGRSASVSFVPRMNAAALAARLHACVEAGSAGVAVQALDHVLVREALGRLAVAGIPLVTVLTDVAEVPRLAYVGLDNRAAGRTAGFLMTRFCTAPGRLAIVWGGELYRSHEERESGFRNLVRAERPDLQCLDVVTGGDDADITRAAVAELLRREPGLAGIYSVGGGVTGVIDAVRAAAQGAKGRRDGPILIAHNYNAQSKHALLDGTIDALIHQDVGRIAALAAEALLRRRAPEGGVATEIITRENNARR